jgi:retron-type reverse transcriptase
MRRAKQLFDRIPERANLELAAQKALRGKRRKGDAIAYVARLDENLNDLAEQLHTGKIKVGSCTEFTIHDPKERLITAPCFAERVLHHAIMNVCEPEFEKRLIHHTYACRRGKGQFAALAAASRFARRSEWFLKSDVRKYFESIPKDGLLARIERVFAEPRLLELFSKIVHAHRPGEERGLPIGSLISQHCANLYLDPIDRQMTSVLLCGRYVRYMDDFVVWSDDKDGLKSMRSALGAELHEIGLHFKTEPLLNRTRHGMDFLGHRVFSDRVTLNRCSRARFATRSREVAAHLEEGRISEGEAQSRATALCAFTSHYGSAFRRGRARLGRGCVPEARTV